LLMNLIQFSRRPDESASYFMNLSVIAYLMGDDSSLLEPDTASIFGVSTAAHAMFHQCETVFAKWSAEHVDSLNAALRETLQEYTGEYESKASDRRYLLALHKPGKPEHVYMTMSIRLHDNGKIEHRHIIQSVYAALIHDDVPPTRISLLMHSTALKYLHILHPERNVLSVEPLKAMYKVMASVKLVPPIVDEAKQVYSVTFSGKDFERLRDGDWASCVLCSMSAQLCEMCEVNLMYF
jgi:hypothetical protein